MSKKILVLILATVVVLGTLIVPSSASMVNLQSELFFNVDFRTGSSEEITGNYGPDENNTTCDPIIIEEDPELGEKVAVFNADNYGMIAWENVNEEDFIGYDLTQGLTVEIFTYIDLDEVNQRQCIAFFGSGYGEFGISEYNNEEDILSGFVSGWGSDASGDWDQGTTFQEKIFPHHQWLHIVGTSDGEKNYCYLNGQLYAERDREGYTEVSTMFRQKLPTVTMGDSIYGTMWGDFHLEGKIAFARIYKAFATAQDVGELYAAAGSTEPIVPIGTPVPTPEPTPEPVVVDATKLDATIASAAGIKAEDYTEESYAAFSAALAAANAAKANPVSQEDTDAKAAALEAAIAALETKGLPLGALIGIIAGGVVVVAGAAVAVILILKKKKAGGNGPQGPAVPQGFNPAVPQRPQGAPMPPRPQGAPQGMPPRPPMPPKPPINR